MTDGCDVSSKIALRWTSLDLCDDKSTLVQVTAWCDQAISHYLNQCWCHMASLGHNVLSHPGLGLLYAFSSFPPPHQSLSLQWLLLFTVKLFKLKLGCLGQRKYRSGKMYWMTFRWPQPKVMAVALIKKKKAYLQRFRNRCVLCHIPIKTKRVSSATKYLCPGEAS